MAQLLPYNKGLIEIAIVSIAQMGTKTSSPLVDEVADEPKQEPSASKPLARCYIGPRRPIPLELPSHLLKYVGSFLSWIDNRALRLCCKMPYYPQPPFKRYLDKALERLGLDPLVMTKLLTEGSSRPAGPSRRWALACNGDFGFLYSVMFGASVWRGIIDFYLVDQEAGANEDAVQLSSIETDIIASALVGGKKYIRYSVSTDKPMVYSYSRFSLAFHRQYYNLENFQIQYRLDGQGVNAINGGLFITDIGTLVGNHD